MIKLFVQTNAQWDKNHFIPDEQILGKNMSNMSNMLNRGFLE